MTALRAFRRPALWRGAWVAMIAATLIVCLVPMPATRQPIEHFDKIEHLVGYLLLSAYAAMLFATRVAVGRAMLALLALGASIEVLQALLPWRSTDAWDMVANSIGVFAGALVVFTPLSGALQWLDRRLP